MLYVIVNGSPRVYDNMEQSAVKTILDASGYTYTFTDAAGYQAAYESAITTRYTSL